MAWTSAPRRPRPPSRMCAWCAQSFRLGPRRYWVDFCGDGHWYLAQKRRMADLSPKSPQD